MNRHNDNASRAGPDLCTVDSGYEHGGDRREVIGTALALEAFCIGVAVILVLLVIAPKDDYEK